MKNEFKDAELSCAEAKEALVSGRDLEAEELSAMQEYQDPQWRVSPHRRWKSSCQTLDCGSRQAYVVVSVSCRLAMRCVLAQCGF